MPKNSVTVCVSFIILFLIMWVFAAFGEEFIFGGYYMKHFAEFLETQTNLGAFQQLFYQFTLEFRIIIKGLRT